MYKAYASELSILLFVGLLFYVGHAFWVVSNHFRYLDWKKAQYQHNFDAFGRPFIKVWLTEDELDEWETMVGLYR